MKVLLFLIGAIALTIGTMAGVLLHPTSRKPAPPAAATASAEPPVPTSKHTLWRQLWTHAVPNIRDLSLAEDGSSVAWVDSNGSVRRLDGANGDTLWQAAPIEGLNRVCAGENGNIFAYSRLNPMQASVHLFSSAAPAAGSPPKIVAYPVEGAVWSVDTADYPDGSSAAAVGTGHSLLYLLPIARGKSPVSATPSPAASATPAPPLGPQRIGVQGIPYTLDMVGGESNASAKAASILAGTWQDSGVTVWSATGAPLMRKDDDKRPDQQYDVHLSADGLTAVAVISRRPNGKEANIHVWDIRRGQQPLWTEPPMNATDVHTLVSPHGDFVALSYKSGDAEEDAESRRIALFDRKGNRCFPDMGGRFFAPQLVALSAFGGHAHVTVYEAAGYLYTLDEGGQILSRLPLRKDSKTGAPPSIDRTLTTHDGRYLLLQTGDGQIALYKANSV